MFDIIEGEVSQLAMLAGFVFQCKNIWVVMLNKLLSLYFKKFSDDNDFSWDPFLYLDHRIRRKVTLAKQRQTHLYNVS